MTSAILVEDEIKPVKKQPKLLKHQFTKEWKAYQLKQLSLMYPEVSESDLSDLLDEQIEKRMINPNCSLHNNYLNRYQKTNLLTFVDWVKETKPIISGFGCLYKNQDQAFSPEAALLEIFMNKRKEYKSQLKKYDRLSYEYAMFDRFQMVEKISANSMYGAGGCPTFKSFNLYTASSTTSTGQLLISTAQACFEYFLSNNNPFRSYSECQQYIENITTEKFNLSNKIIPNISIKRCFERLKSMFAEGVYKEEYDILIYRTLKALPQNMINRIYFKNNLYEFCRLPKPKKIIIDMLEKVNDPNSVKNPKPSVNIDPKGKGDVWEFTNAGDPPKNIQKELEDFWTLLKEFVLYNYFVWDRIDRQKHQKRQTVVALDTDSNILTITPWMELCEELSKDNEKILNKDKGTMYYAEVNIMAYQLTHVIAEAMYHFTTTANYLERYKPRILMKNEFLFNVMVICDTKKRYISTQLLREGELLVPPKPDVKGLDFIKSTTSLDVKNKFMDIIDRNIYSLKYDVHQTLRDIMDMEKEIIESLRNGERKYSTPAKVNDMESYKFPYRIPGMRGTIFWDIAYPQKEIQLPTELDVFKVNLTTEEQLESVKQYDEEVYNRLLEGVFHSGNPDLYKRGINVIAIPRGEDVPDWVIQAIDTTTISKDIISKFFPVLDSLRIQIFGNKDYYSNIIQL